MHRRVGVEGAQRLRAFESVDPVEHRHHRLPTSVEGLAHDCHRRQIPGHGCECGPLRHIRHVRRRMRLQVGGRLHHIRRRDHPAHSPAGHRIGLGHSVDDDAGVSQFGNLDRHRRRLRPGVGEVFVDLVREHPDALLVRPLADLANLIPRVDGTGWVGRRAEQQRLGPIGALTGELVDSHPVARGRVGQHLHRHAAGQPDRLRIGGPVRRGEEDFVAGVEHGRERLVHRLLAAIGHQHVRGPDVVPGVTGRLGRDRLPQLGKAASRRIPVVARVAAGLDRRLDDVVGGRKVRLSCRETDDRASGRLQRLGLGVDGERRRLRDRTDSGGDASGCDVRRRWTGHALILAPPRLRRRCGSTRGARYPYTRLSGGRTTPAEARPRCA
jgi:hypothetical protein